MQRKFLGIVFVSSFLWGALATTHAIASYYPPVKGSCSCAKPGWDVVPIDLGGGMLGVTCMEDKTFDDPDNFDTELPENCKCRKGFTLTTGEDNSQICVSDDTTDKA